MVDKNVLSQEEIDALLKAVGESSEGEDQEFWTQAAASDKKKKGSKKQPTDTPFEPVEITREGAVKITVEIGRTNMTIRNLLQLQQGLVSLDRLAGTPLEVLVNGTVVAHGEVVVINDKFGVRLTDIVSKAERIKRLK